MPAASVLLAAFLLQANATAASAPPDGEVAAVEAQAGVISFAREFFASARPTSAFDMVGRLPGFTFSGGDNVRGFAGAAGNVLIDGERPTSKAVTLEELLRRLPAGEVVRIDVIRGGAPGIDMQGQAIIANVIRSKAASQNLAVAAGARIYTQDGWIGPQADLEWTRRQGALSVEGAVRFSGMASPNGGDGELTKYFPDGSLKENGPYLQRSRTATTSANGSAELDLGDSLYRLNIGASRSDMQPYERVGRFSPTSVNRGEVVTGGQTTTDKLEFSGDYTRQIGPGLSAQVLGLQTLGWVDGASSSLQPGSVQASSTEETSGETIGRATLSWRPGDNLSLETGGEAAFNFLEGSTKVSSNGVIVPVANANLRVEERRAEAFVTSVWKPIPTLSVDAGVRAETSELSSSGDTAQSRSFFFAKPRLVLAYAPDAATQLRLRLQREVGQLRFRDFVASAELATGTIVAGNAELEPERAWVIEATAERRFWGKGAIVATVAHEAVEQVVDLIPVGPRDAPGNIGDGTRDRLTLSGALPLDRLGVKQGLITGQATWRRSEVTDPVTGQARRISNELPFGGKVVFTQDVARLASTWGIEGQFGEVSTTYRISEIREQAETGLVSVYWDWKPDSTLSVRAEFRNLNSRERERTRERFTGSRAANILNETEIEVHRFAPFAFVRVRKSF